MSLISPFGLLQLGIEADEMQPVIDKLNSIKASLDSMGSAYNPDSPLRKIGLLYVENTLLRFKTHTSPDGRAWKRLQPATVKLKKKGSGKRGPSIESPYNQLIWTGALRKSIKVRFSGKNGIQVGVFDKLAYAAAQQFGSIKKNIPARKFLGSNKKTNAVALKIIADYIQRAAGTP